MEDLESRIALAREALALSRDFQRTGPAAAGDALSLNVQLEHDIADMEAEMRELEGRDKR